MATDEAIRAKHERLVQMIPFVLDFLELDSEDILASGILDDDDLDEMVILMLLSHNVERSKEKLSVSNSSVCNIPDDNQTQTHETADGTRHTLYTDDSEQTTNQQMSRDNLVKSEERHNFFCSASKVLLNDFRCHFRMTSSMFEMLLQNMMMLTSFSSMKQHLCSLSGKGDQISEPAAMLLLTLKFLGCKQPTSELAENTDVHEDKLLEVLLKTVSALYELMQYYIKWPKQEYFKEIASSFRQKCHLENVRGAIDILHIAVKAPKQQSKYYTNLQGDTTVSLQTVCDHELHFLHCCTGWPGSVDDSAVFLDSDLYSDASKNVDTYFPDGAYLVGDEAFPLTEWLMKPFDEDATVTASQLCFNAACHEVVKHSSAAHTLLLQRFPRLDYVDISDMQNMVIMILVCCALHNFCLDYGDKQSFEDAQVTVRNINTHPASPASGMPKRTELGEQKRQILQQLLALNSS